MRTTGTSIERIRSAYVALLRKTQRRIEKPSPTDTVVHDIRKSLKRARAAVRLLRPGIGEIAYRSANRALRDLARPLGGARDAQVLATTAAALLKELPSSTSRAALEPLRRRMHDEHLAAHKRALTAQTRRAIGARLSDEIERASHWRLTKMRAKDLQTATDKIYRKYNKAMRHAKNKGTAQALHEWRKQAKYLRHALEFREHAHGQIKRLKKLTDFLGDDHDLWVLRAKIQHERRKTGIADLVLTLDERRDDLQHHAFAVGKKS